LKNSENSKTPEQMKKKPESTPEASFTEPVHMNIVSVFEYFDYHQYLSDYYEARKKNDPRFSHRTFLTAAGIPGTVYLMRVQNGQKLSDNHIPHFINALGLTDLEAKYFKALVHFQNEKNSGAKEHYCREMLTLRSSRNEFRINDNRLGIFEKWYYPVVWQFACMNGFTDNYTSLGNRIIPRIKASQVEEAIEFLSSNGFIIRNEDGTWSFAAPSLNTADEVRSTLLRKYHRKTLEHCIDALDSVDQENREISSSVLSVSRERYLQIKREIQQFRNRLLDLAASDDQPADIVCHTGFQLIPRTRSKNE
jgi:uncharacterized protein (TIGR02147 family)